MFPTISKALAKKLGVLLVVIINILLVACVLYLKFKDNPLLIKPLDRTIQVINGFISSSPDKTVYGYLPSWMLSNAKYIHYDKLTDIAYFGLRLDGKGNFMTRNNGEVEMGYSHWNNSKTLDDVIRNAKRHNVRFALTIISQNNENIDTFLRCKYCWHTALSNISGELKKKNITDVNVDFEHTTETTEQTANLYTEFVAFLNTNLDKEFGDSKVVVATFADSYKRIRITKPKDLAKAADALFVMAYDYSQPTSESAGPVAPLKGLNYNVSDTINEYKKDVSTSKLILGVPYYGYNFLVNSNDRFAERVPGNDVLGYSVSQNYALIKDSDNVPKDQVRWDAASETPYVIYKSKETGMLRVLHFENEDSLRKKYDFVKEQGLLGVGIWALGYDGDYKELWELIAAVFK